MMSILSNSKNTSNASINGNKYLSGDGSWKVVSGGGSSFDPSTLRLNTITSSADVSLNTNKLTNVKDPTSAQDASTKNYVDNKLS